MFKFLTNYKSFSNKKKRLINFLVALFVTLLFMAIAAQPFALFMTDKFLFMELGKNDVWNTLFLNKLLPVLVVFAIFLAFILLNLILSGKYQPADREKTYSLNENKQVTIPTFTKTSKRLLIGGLSLLGTSIAMPDVLSKWNEWILFFNSSKVGEKDVIFNKDISYYLFKWPLLMSIANWVLVLVIVTAIVVVVYSFLLGSIDISTKPIVFTKGVQVHLTLLLAAAALAKAVVAYFDRYSVLFASQKAFDGAGYTQVKAVLPAKNLMVVLWLILAIVLIYFAFKKFIVFPAVTVAAVIVVSVLLQTTYPFLIQKFSVGPNEIAKEKEYVERNIKATKKAFNLENVEVKERKYETELSPEDSQSALDSLENTILWDERSLSWYLSQRKEGAFYNFSTPTNVIRENPDTKKVEHDLVAARELVPAEELPDTSWTSRHLVCTGGQGVQVASATDVADQNQPVYKDLVKGEDSRILFGASFKDYVIVNTDQKEQGVKDDKPIDVGDNVSGFFKKAMYSLKYSDYNLFVSSQVNSKSNIIQYRNPIERVQKIAPFLFFDSKPYLSVVDEKLVWVIDAYTGSEHFPYSQAISADVNYIRHSVKATVDAYSGQVDMYVWDNKDVILKAYKKAFPKLFTSKVPSELKKYQRYPYDLFQLQSSLLAKYHIEDGEQFLKGSDFFRVSPRIDIEELQDQNITSTTIANTSAPASSLEAPVYIKQEYDGGETMGEKDFVAVRTYVPLNTSFRMASFITGSSDEKLTLNVITNPRNDSVLSLEQLEGQIQSTESISQQFTLLSQRGSEIIPGDMQIVPGGKSLLFARPYFVKGNSDDAIPQLTFVVISQKGASVCGSNYAEAVKNLIDNKASCNVFKFVAAGIKKDLEKVKDQVNEKEAKGEPSNGKITSGEIDGLIAELSQASKDYQEALDAKDLGKLQAAADKMSAIAKKLEESK